MDKVNPTIQVRYISPFSLTVKKREATVNSKGCAVRVFRFEDAGPYTELEGKDGNVIPSLLESEM